MYSNTESVVQVNSFFLRLFAIKHSVRQSSLQPPLLYVVDPVPLLRRFEAMEIIRLICYGRGVTVHADNVTVIMSDEGQLSQVEDVIKRYEM